MWGDSKKSVHFNFFESVNFIIGVNGSGKTTVINLLAAALQCDLHTLDKQNFNRIIINLYNPKDENIEVKIEKEEAKETPYSNIVYSIKIGSKKSKKYKLNSYFDERYMMNVRSHYMFIDGEIGGFNNSHPMELQNILSGLVSSSWLSVHRTAALQKKEIRDAESPVDIKLKEVVAELIKFFSTLDKLNVEEQSLFQEKVFLALLYENSKNKESFIKKNLDLDKEKEHLKEIFIQFNINKKDAQSKLDNHFIHVGEAYKEYENSNTFGFEHIKALVLNSRIDKIIDEWTKYNEKKRKIYEPREMFFTILGDLFQRKKVSVGNNNEIKIETQSGKVLHMNSLSSGEKQLLIVLGQALLQNKKEWVYIADEPELSLHVKWQDCLVDNIRKLNPNAQIIFATHSPDIVGAYSDNVFDMEQQF